MLETLSTLWGLDDIFGGHAEFVTNIDEFRIQIIIFLKTYIFFDLFHDKWVIGGDEYGLEEVSCDNLPCPDIK